MYSYCWLNIYMYRLLLEIVPFGFCLWGPIYIYKYICKIIVGWIIHLYILNIYLLSIKNEYIYMLGGCLCIYIYI